MGLLKKIRTDEYVFYIGLNSEEAREHFKRILSEKQKEQDIRGEFIDETNFRISNKPESSSGGVSISGKLLNSGNYTGVHIKTHSSFRLLIFVLACICTGTAFFIISFLESRLDVFRIGVSLVFVLFMPWGLIHLNQLLKDELTYIFFKAFQLNKNPPAQKKDGI